MTPRVDGSAGTAGASARPGSPLMKAAIYEKYGPPEVVVVKDIEKPNPKSDEVLVRILSTTVSAADWRFRRADPVILRFMNGLLRPKKIRILGMEFAGTVEAVGGGVTRFRKGDSVFGSAGFKFGTHAEYVCLTEDAPMATMPANLTFDEAAAVMFGGVSALYFLKKAEIRAGHNVLVYGASGSVGVFAVQLAKHFGARVTGVCSTANLDLVKSLGAETVVDYTREDFSMAGRIYDIVLDTVGKSGYARSLRSLKRGGAYVLVGGSGRLTSMFANALKKRWVSAMSSTRVIGGVAGEPSKALPVLKGLFEEGKLRTVIDRRYSLDRIVEAHRYVEAGHKRGHVIVNPQQTNR